MLMCIQNLVRFCPAFLKILSEKRNSDVNQGPSPSKFCMMGNDPKLVIVNVDVHTKFGETLSSHSQDIERKRNSDVNQGP